MEKAKIDRINELGRISKTRELTEEEKKEQKDDKRKSIDAGIKNR